MLEGLNKIVDGDDTIVAIATPPGRSAIGLLRLSGPHALSITQKLFQSATPLEHRHQIVGKWHRSDGTLLDEVTVVFARHPHSYTGEDLVEISTHGNPASMSRIVESVRECGARLAGPGEFTLRAVTNGKLDLMQAEAVREFIEAQTEHQARTALQQMEGAGARKIAPLKQVLIDVIAHLEAGIDFAEDDVEIPDSSRMAGELSPLIQELSLVKDTFGYGRILSRGLNLAILGKPNVGKSSLFNSLLSLDRAIVTEVPGTTRDVLTEGLNLEGIPLRLMDTAGIRETSDHVERIGVGKSLEAIAAADLAIVVLDGSRSMDHEDEHILKRTADIPHMLVLNKIDLPQVIRIPVNGNPPIPLSARSGLGVDALRSAIATYIKGRKSDSTEDFILTNERQHEAVGRAIASLQSAQRAFASNVPHEMVLLDLYAALSALNELTGESVTEDILNRIFSTFCIGK